MLITHILIRDLPHEEFRLFPAMSDGKEIESSSLSDVMKSAVLDDAHKPIGWAIYKRVETSHLTPTYELAGLRGVES